MSEYVAPPRGVDVMTESTNQDVDYPVAGEPIQEWRHPDDWTNENPLPVYQVQLPNPQSISQWSGERFFVDSGQPVELAGAKRNRTRLLLKNKGPNSVFLNDNSSVNTALAYELAMGDEPLELRHNSNVWAKCATGETASVSVVQEWDVDMDLSKPE